MKKCYRDCQAWRDDGMPLNTSSDEVCKLYDAIVTQTATRQEDKAVGPMEDLIKRMMQADPNFIMGHVLQSYEAEAPIDSKLITAQWDQLSDMEKGHVKALQNISQGHYDRACVELEGILRNYPRDFVALKTLYMYRLLMGHFQQQRDDVARVLPFYNRKTDVEYGYVVGFHAFSLEETNLYDAAEKKAKEALDCDRRDAWASHSLAHVYEMTSRYNEGLEFLSSTQKDWEVITDLACHINWHRTLFHIEKGDIEGALNVYDNEVRGRVKASGDMFPISDAVGMLYRLKMQGIDAGRERWQEVGDLLVKKLEPQSWSFYNPCVMIGLCGAGQHEEAASFIEKFRAYSNKNEGNYLGEVSKTVTLDLCSAIYSYFEGDYESAVDTAMPIRYDFQQLGGSHAQRDLFQLFLVSAAAKSEKSEHQRIARQLMHERKSLKDTPLNNSLYADIVKEFQEEIQKC